MEMQAIWKTIESDDGTVLYEGFTLFGKPFGFGTAFYPNGKEYQEGMFYIKGLIYGKEYYPSGTLRFEGTYNLHKGYGPNYPVYGDCFDRDGHRIYDGRLEIRKGGVGYPMVVYPESFGPLPQPESPKIDCFLWDDARKAGISY